MYTSRTYSIRKSGHATITVATRVTDVRQGRQSEPISYQAITGGVIEGEKINEKLIVMAYSITKEM